MRAFEFYEQTRRTLNMKPVAGFAAAPTQRNPLEWFAGFGALFLTLFLGDETGKRLATFQETIKDSPDLGQTANSRTGAGLG